MDATVPSARRLRNLSWLVAGVIASLWVLGGVLLYSDRGVVYGNDWFLWELSR